MRSGLRATTPRAPSTTHYNHLKKQGSNFTSLVALNFAAECDVICYYLIFHVPIFLIALMNYVNDQKQPFTTVQGK